MALDLSMFDQPDLGVLPTQHQIGAVLDLPIDDIEEDPEQPRRTFAQSSLEAMAARIRRKGCIEVPIKVRPKHNGKFRIVDGARRYRASLLAGTPTIRAIVEADTTAIDAYTQVVMNLQREELKPMELAQFIASRHAGGDSLGEIAQELGIGADAVTAHLALLNAPVPVLQAFDTGSLKSVRSVYELCRLHEHDAHGVEAFLQQHADQDITRSMIRRFAESLRANVPGGLNPESSAGEHATPLPTNEANEALNDAATSGAEPAIAHGSGQAQTQTPPPKPLPFHNPDVERETKAPKVEDPTRMKKPLLLADFDGDAVMVCLFKRPSSPGLAFVKYEDGRGEVEVDLARLSNWTLMESKV